MNDITEQAQLEKERILSWMQDPVTVRMVRLVHQDLNAARLKLETMETTDPNVKAQQQRIADRKLFVETPDIWFRRAEQLIAGERSAEEEDRIINP